MCEHGHHFTGIRTLDDIKARCFVTESGCWRWLREDNDGVPVTYFNPFKGRSTVGACIHYILHGRRVPKDSLFRFNCGTPLCVNPEHGYVQKRSIALTGKRRNPRLHAAQITMTLRARSKLTPADIEQIKASPLMGTQVAAQYGISQAHVSRIRRGVCWAPIASPASVFNLGAQA